jgi:hypothetical protein
MQMNNASIDGKFETTPEPSGFIQALKALKYSLEFALVPGKLWKTTQEQAKEEGLGFSEKAILYPGALLGEGIRLTGYLVIAYKLAEKLF